MIKIILNISSAYVREALTSMRLAKSALLCTPELYMLKTYILHTFLMILGLKNLYYEFGPEVQPFRIPFTLFLIIFFTTTIIKYICYTDISRVREIRIISTSKLSQLTEFSTFRNHSFSSSISKIDLTVPLYITCISTRI